MTQSAPLPTPRDWPYEGEGKEKVTWNRESQASTTALLGTVVGCADMAEQPLTEPEALIRVARLLRIPSEDCRVCTLLRGHVTRPEPQLQG